MAGERSRFKRWLRHLWIGPLQVSRAFPAQAYARIEQAIEQGERQHRAEVRFAVESSLSTGAIWSRMGARDRAVQLFAEFGIWDTEEDNGILLYLLWADHAIEVVADRGAARRVDPQVWAHACEAVRASFAAGRHVEGVVEAIEIVNRALAEAFPVEAQGDRGELPNRDELPNRPLVL